MKDLRPISLCNVIYNIISKILTRRLQPFMDKLISSKQNAFIKGRLILDNILVCHQAKHYLKNKKEGRNYGMAVKLDVSKAYDSVERGYLRQ